MALKFCDDFNWKLTIDWRYWPSEFFFFFNAGHTADVYLATWLKSEKFIRQSHTAGVYINLRIYEWEKEFSDWGDRCEFLSNCDFVQNWRHKDKLFSEARSYHFHPVLAIIDLCARFELQVHLILRGSRKWKIVLLRLWANWLCNPWVDSMANRYISDLRVLCMRLNHNEDKT